jgi:hypothetical protein
MTEFTVEANLWRNIKDKATQKEIKDWGAEIENFESDVMVLVRKLTRVQVSTRDVARACEDRLKEKGIEKAEKENLEEVLGLAKDFLKKFRALEAFN